MKRIILTVTGLVITGLWAWFMCARLSGLNSLGAITSYRNGLLAHTDVYTPAATTLAHTGYEATIRLDSLHIPRIEASTAGAQAYALGYMHARERSFQMQLLAAMVMGRLSEILGANGIESDREWKTFALEAKAEEMLAAVGQTDPALYQYLVAYAAGVNAFLQQETPLQRDPLFMVWNYQPRTWKPAYSFLLQWYLSARLAYYDDYVNKQELLDKVSATVRNTLYPEASAQTCFIIPGSQPVPATQWQQPSLGMFEKNTPNYYAAKPYNKSLGSNNWVAGKTHTANGKIYLCNDLHLVATAPALLYEVQMQNGSQLVHGFSIPGVPLVVSGYNRQVAWGITNAGWDVTEQYLLRINPSNAQQYWYNHHWENFTTRSFTIQVKGQAPYTFTEQYTLMGKVVRKNNIVYALRWHAANSCGSLQALWNVMQAHDWASFRQALQTYDYPAQNFVYADTKGHIGVVCAGKMPLKPAGYDGGMLDGTVPPLTGYIPFDSLPQAFDPAQDYVFSANQEPIRNGYYYSAKWFDDLYRPRRIALLLQQGKQLTRESMRQMQLDVQDEAVPELQQLLKKYLPEKEWPSSWKSWMQWNGVVDAGDNNTFFYQCIREAFKRTGKELAAALQVRQTPSFDQLVHYFEKGVAVKDSALEIAPGAVFTKLVHTADSLYTATGKQARQVAMVLPQVTALPGLNVEIASAGGNDNTINVNSGAHAVIRTVIEIDSTGIRGWMVNAGGQSGRVNSTGYMQQLNDWKVNRLHTLAAQPATAADAAIIYLKK